MTTNEQAAREVAELLNAAEEVCRLMEAARRPHEPQSRYVLMSHADNGQAAVERLRRAIRAMYADG